MSEKRSDERKTDGKNRSNPGDHRVADSCGCFYVVDPCGCRVVDPCGCYVSQCCS